MSQTEELSRVQANIGELVEQFVLDRWQTGEPRFYIQDLHDYIATRTQIAPASPDRILRHLRLEGKFDYKVVNRSDSCYEVTAINPGPKRKPAKTAAIKRNPKQEGTSYFDCIPQTGPCPIGTICDVSGCDAHDASHCECVTPACSPTSSPPPKTDSAAGT